MSLTIDEYIAAEREAVAAADVRALEDLQLERDQWRPNEVLYYELKMMEQPTAEPKAPQRRPGPKPRGETLVALGYALARRDEGDSQEAAAEAAADRFAVSASTIQDKLKAYEKEHPNTGW